MPTVHTNNTMPFGKWRGTPVTDVPTDYLEWAIGAGAVKSDYLRDLIKEEIDKRCKAQETFDFGQKRSGFDDAWNRWQREQKRQAEQAQRDEQRRRQSMQHNGRRPEMATSARMLEIIAAGRRALAARHHPDQGGDAEIMRAVNVTADYMEEQVRRAES